MVPGLVNTECFGTEYFGMGLGAGLCKLFPPTGLYPVANGIGEHQRSVQATIVLRPSSRQCHVRCIQDDRSKPSTNYTTVTLLYHRDSYTTVTLHLYHDHHSQAWNDDEQVKYQNWRLKTGDARPK